MTKIHSQALEYSKAGVGNFWDEATKVWNDIMIMDDLGEHTEASKRLPEAIRCYATAFRKERLNCQYIQTLLPSVVTERYGSYMMTRHGTYVNGGECGRTLMSFAAGEGDKDIVKLLLDTINPDLKDGNFGLTPLSWAARNGHEAVVKLLLETGKVEADSKDDFLCETPLSWAAKNGHKAVIKLLLETGKVDADSRSGCSQTPLFLAAKNGHNTVVKLLLKTAKVEADSKDLFSRTPLSWAAENGHEAVVKLLLETGKVKADYVSGSGETPLSRAGSNGHEIIVNLLNAVWAPINYRSGLSISNRYRLSDR
jgi:ankyrin repeat protein